MNDSTNNRNPHREFITPDNVVMLFVDHQAATMTGIGDIDPVRFRNNVIALAKIAKLTCQIAPHAPEARAAVAPHRGSARSDP